MAWFSKFKLLIAIKEYIGGQFQKEISNFSYFKTLGKCQKKVVVAEKIGCGNEIVFSKIGWGYENDIVLSIVKSLVLGGLVDEWVDRWVDGWMEVKAVLMLTALKNLMMVSYGISWFLR